MVTVRDLMTSVVQTLSIGDTRGSGERKGPHSGEDDEPADHGEKRTVATHEG